MSDTPRRVRLSAQARRTQILDAALSEFSAVGFEGATMDKIAQRTGLTKAGLYAHFDSKEQLLEELLVSNVFSPSETSHWQFKQGDTLADAIDAYLENLYRLIADPKMQATFRLLIIESGRSSERVRRWSDAIFKPYVMQRQMSVQDSVARGLIPDNTLTRKFSLASSPALQALMSCWFLAPEEASIEVVQIRAWHKEMLLTMLSQGDKS